MKFITFMSMVLFAAAASAQVDSECEPVPDGVAPYQDRNQRDPVIDVVLDEGEAPEVCSCVPVHLVPRSEDPVEVQADRLKRFVLSFNGNFLVVGTPGGDHTGTDAVHPGQHVCFDVSPYVDLSAPDLIYESTAYVRERCIGDDGVPTAPDPEKGFAEGDHACTGKEAGADGGRTPAALARFRFRVRTPEQTWDAPWFVRP